MTTRTFETILYGVDDGIATITLNRPERLNAFTTGMMSDMIAAFDETDADDAVKAVNVTGAARGLGARAGRSPAPTFPRAATPSTATPGARPPARRPRSATSTATAAAC